MTVTSHLKAYLESFGNVLPVDLEEHVDGIFRGRCLFCTKTDDNIPVNKYDINRELVTEVTPTLAKCCKACGQLINDMVAINFPDVRDEQIQTNMSQKSEKTYVEDHGRKEYRIKIFNTKKGLERFDKSLATSYLHVAYKMGVKDPGWHCYFCKVTFFPENTIAPTVIKVPVYDSKKITGGELAVCEECLKEIWDIEAQDNLETKCSYCSKPYYISPEEHNIRVSQNTVGKHMCPPCTYGGLNEQIFSVKRSVLFSNIIAIKTGERFDFIECHHCASQFVVDFTIDHVRLIRTRQAGGKPICGTCFVFKLGKVNGNKFVFQVMDSGYFVVINQVDGYWVYRISTIKDGQEYVQLKPDMMSCRSKNILEVIDTGHDQCLKLVTPQLKLDLDGNE